MEKTHPEKKLKDKDGDWNWTKQMPTPHTGTWQGVRGRGITENKVEISDQMRKKLDIGI